MSQQLISRSEDLQRLRNEGYDISVKYDHLVIRDIPYVTAKREVALGYMVTNLELTNNVTHKPSRHVMLFGGEFPCDQHGNRLDKINAGGATAPGPELPVQHSFSTKPRDVGYKDYYEKVTTYVNILLGPAQVINPEATAQTYPTIRASEEESVFNYLDTASSRAGITAVNLKLEMGKVVILGLGGTGSYVLDLVAKTPVKEIHLYDGDRYLQHNAFRSPGATSPESLEARPSKAAYFKEQYSQFRRNIFEHAYHVDESNMQELRDMSFAFICIDDGVAKKKIVTALIEYGVPFIDVGTGLRLQEGSIAGAVRVTAVTKEKQDHVARSISFGEYKGEDVYAQNIQVADLNALNAALAVIKWKKLLGFYVDSDKEHQAVYTVDWNFLSNEELTCQSFLP